MSNRQLARDMQVEFQARFQAKQARREAVKAAKEVPMLRKQIQDLLKNGETKKAQEKARFLLSKQALIQQLDQMADMAELSSAQIKNNNQITRMTQLMNQSTRTMDMAQKNFNLEKVVGVTTNYQQKIADGNMSNGILQEAMSESQAGQVGDDSVHELLGKLADDAGIELSKELSQATPAAVEPQSAATEPTAEEEDRLQERLRALRA